MLQLIESIILQHFLGLVDHIKPEMHIYKLETKKNGVNDWQIVLLRDITK